MGPLGDDDFSVPPIAPSEHMLPPHLPHSSSSGPYTPLDPPSTSAPPHHPYQLQGMNQDGRAYSPEGALMTSTLSVVSALGTGDGGDSQIHTCPKMDERSTNQLVCKRKH